MNTVELNELFLKKLSEVVVKGFKQDPFLSTLYDTFSEKNRAFIEELQNKNRILTDTFKSIGRMYGIAYSEPYSVNDLEKKITEFKDCIYSLIGNEYPKRPVLCYSYSDDCGHSYCDIVIKKDIDYVNKIFSNELMDTEYLFYDNFILLRPMSEKLNKSIDQLLDLETDDMIDTIKVFFGMIIEDKSVSLHRFSEFIEAIVPTGRHSGSACNWVYFGGDING